MKFMKLGSKPDSFQTEGNDIRYVATELASDIIVIVGDVKFYLHKFPLLSKSILLQKLVAISTAENSDEIRILDIPGGPVAFETCAKFCYGMAITLNPYNVVLTRCASEYLGMHESLDKGNLIYKIDVFLSSSIFRSWKDSIIALQSTTSLLPLAEDLKIVSHCIDSVASKASTDISRVDWSYTYNRKKLSEENGNDPNSNGIKTRDVPKDWWVEDLCELRIELFMRVIMSIKSKSAISNEVVGEALKSYTVRQFPGFGKNMIECGDVENVSMVLNTIVWLLPAEKNSVSCSFLLKLLKATNMADSCENSKRELIRKIGQQLEAASVNDLLIRAPPQEGHTIYDVDTVKNIVEEFITQDRNAEIEALESQEMRRPGILSNASKLMVVKLVDGYLAEIAKDPNLPLLKFFDLAEMVSRFSRPSHDGLYRAIDMYLKEHSGITKSERKKICKLMDCKKLSADACMHAVQNERLPMRVVVQILFFEQIRAAATSGSNTPDLPKCIKDLNNNSNGSSRSTTNLEEDWDALATADELKALKGELASLRLNGGRSSRGSGRNTPDCKNSCDKVSISKVKNLLVSKKVFKRLWSKKGTPCDNSESDSPESPSSANQDEAKTTPSRTNRRYSVS